MPIKPENRIRLRRLIIVVFCVAVVFFAFSLDAPVASILKSPVGGRMHIFAGLLSKIGDWPCLLMVGILFSLFLFVRGCVECSRLLLVVLLAGSLAGFSATLVRSTVGRTRPSSHQTQGFYGPYHEAHWTVGKYEFGSFPSGHTATVAGLTAALWMWRRRWALAFGLFAVMVAWSRIALNCHHFSDVVAAGIWGALAGPWLFSLVRPKIPGWQWFQRFSSRQSAANVPVPLGQLEIPQV